MWGEKPEYFVSIYMIAHEYEPEISQCNANTNFIALPKKPYQIHQIGCFQCGVFRFEVDSV